MHKTEGRPEKHKLGLQNPSRRVLERKTAKKSPLTRLRRPEKLPAMIPAGENPTGGTQPTTSAVPTEKGEAK